MKVRLPHGPISIGHSRCLKRCHKSKTRVEGHSPQILSGLQLPGPPGPGGTLHFVTFKCFFLHDMVMSNLLCVLNILQRGVSLARGTHKPWGHLEHLR